MTGLGNVLSLTLSRPVAVQNFKIGSELTEKSTKSMCSSPDNCVIDYNQDSGARQCRASVSAGAPVVVPARII